MPSRVALLILLTVVLAFAIWPAPAGAGSYDVHACKQQSAHGWAPVASGTGSPFVTTSPCPMTVALPAEAPHGSWAGWRFSAPEATRITGFEVARSANSFVHPPVVVS